MRKAPSNTKYDFGVRWCDNESEYMKAFMKMYNSKRIVCEICKKDLSQGVIQKHRRTKRHLRNLSKQNE